MDYWGGRCPITGITDPALLRASHFVPWAECDDTRNGSMCTMAYSSLHCGMQPSMLASSASPTTEPCSPAPS